MNTLALDAAPASPTLADLAHQAKPDRNRAVDAYRAIAMCCVAFGHWMATAIILEADGDPKGINVLTALPELSWASWLLQVMPLFFMVGGFANGSSLAAAQRAGTPDGRWVASRIRRLLAPVTAFAAVWLGVGLVGLAVPIVAGMAKAAVIPLWFLANYCIDIALAPTMRRLWQRYGWGLLGALWLVIAGLDLARVTELSFGSHWANWVLAWVSFQVLGMAWRDGRLRPTPALAALGIGAVGMAAALVSNGPWQAAMVHVAEVDGFSNTYSPSIPLMFYGIGQCLVAVAAAPHLNRFLARSMRAWTIVVAGNGVAMSVYLWHFPAIAIVGGFGVLTGAMPFHAVGSGAWWIAKAVMMVLALVVLVFVVSLVARYERQGLLDSGPIALRPVAGYYLAVIAAVAFELATKTSAAHPVGIASLVTLLLVGRALTASNDEQAAEAEPERAMLAR